MISASHNPYYDNGIKLINAAGEKMDEETLLKVEAYMDGISGDQAAIHYKGAAVRYTDTAAVPSGVIDDIAILDFSPFRHGQAATVNQHSAAAIPEIAVGQDCAIQQLYRAALSDIQHPAIGPLLLRHLDCNVC